MDDYMVNVRLNITEINRQIDLCKDNLDKLRTEIRQIAKPVDEIEFYIPQNEIVPTRLRLRIDDKYVEYKQDTSTSFVFNFYNEWTQEEAEYAIKRIAKVIERQSDNGYTKFELFDLELCGLTSYRVKFRIVHSLIPFQNGTELN